MKNIKNKFENAWKNRNNKVYPYKMNTKPKKSQSKPVQKQLNQTSMKNMIEFIVPKLSDLAKGKNMIKSYKNAVRNTMNNKFGSKCDMDKLIKNIQPEYDEAWKNRNHKQKTEPIVDKKPIDDKIDVCEWKEGGQLRVQKSIRSFCVWWTENETKTKTNTCHR
eukprot:UN23035